MSQGTDDSLRSLSVAPGPNPLFPTPGPDRICCLHMHPAAIIPTLNEADNLAETISCLHDAFSAAGFEPGGVCIIVADCGSRDGTPDIARSLGCLVVEGDQLTSRARALNAGARACPDEIDLLWFVHADTLVPENAVVEMGRVLTRPAVVGGAFDFNWRPGCPRLTQCVLLAIIRLGNLVRYRITRNYYGDQTLFVRRDIFERVGGYPRRKLLEDTALCRLLRQRGRLVIARATVQTSPRRFLHHGVLRQLFFDLALIGSDRLGWEPASLYERYNRSNRCAPVSSGLAPGTDGP